MEKEFSILIADKNPYVRQFLAQEFIQDGFKVDVVGNHEELFDILDSELLPDLIILDLNIPSIGGISVLMKLGKSEYSIPVVVHTTFTEYETHPAVKAAAAFVEKKGNPARLKNEVAGVLRRNYGERYEKLLSV